MLDWLALDFRDHQWDVKRFYKQILMSATYRQAALATPEKLAKDPENRLFSRGPRYRMEGDQVVLEWRGGREAARCGMVKPEVMAMQILRQHVGHRPIAA